MMDDRRDVQERFLCFLCEKRVPTTIFLVNGIKLQGIITGNDSSSVLLDRDGHVQLVFKHAVSTVMPSAPVVLGEDSTVFG